MLEEGSRDSVPRPFVIFWNSGRDRFVQYGLEDEGMELAFPLDSSLFAKKPFAQKVKELLLSLNFREVSHKEYRNELEEGELFIHEEDGFIYAQFGEDSDFVAYLTNRIFKEIFKLEDDYKIDVELSLEGKFSIHFH